MRLAVTLAAVLTLPPACLPDRPAPVDPVAACVDRAVLFFRRVESYPRLSDGSDARTVAETRCQADPDAF